MHNKKYLYIEKSPKFWFLYDRMREAKIDSTKIKSSLWKVLIKHILKLKLYFSWLNSDYLELPFFMFL